MAYDTTGLSGYAKVYASAINAGKNDAQALAEAAAATSSKSSNSGGSSPVRISQNSYDAQKRQIADNPGVNFLTRDVRNPWVSVGSYSDLTPFTNPVTGASSKGGGNYAYRNPNSALSSIASGQDRQDYMAVAGQGGLGDISSYFTPADLPTYQNALNQLAAGIMASYAAGTDKFTLPSSVVSLLNSIFTQGG